jgi:hypothetical protein
LPQHSARFANDQEEATFWSPARTDSSAWWQVDLEALCLVEQVRLTFPGQGNFYYRIEVSKDAQEWVLAVDHAQMSRLEQRRIERLAKGSQGRFLRITFVNPPDGSPAALAEVEVLGQPVAAAISQ